MGLMTYTAASQKVTIETFYIQSMGFTHIYTISQPLYDSWLFTQPPNWWQYKVRSLLVKGLMTLNGDIRLALYRSAWRSAWEHAAVMEWLTHWTTPQREANLMRKCCRMVSWTMSYFSAFLLKCWIFEQKIKYFFYYFFESDSQLSFDTTTVVLKIEMFKFHT